MPPTDPNYLPAPTIDTLGEAFWDPVEAASFPDHRLRFRNRRWDARVGLADLTQDEWVDHFGRFRPLPDNLTQPLALRYHGHQFGTYNPDLGDGRGFLFGQLRDTEDGRLLDLGTKGTGQTPWSRSGDGRLTLKGGVREVLATELLEALGVYTSRTFSLIETGEALVRNDEPSPTRSSVLVRLNHSHIRFGSFQRHAFHGSAENVSRLLDYSIAHYEPDLSQVAGVDRAAAFLRRVSEKTADLAASWHVAGFVHGVLNTDNMNITGESFDYGPYRFLPTYDSNFVAAYFDHSGLYAFGNQPSRLLWNLTRLAEALSLVSTEDPLVEALETFEPAFHRAIEAHLLRRLGLRGRGESEDRRLAQAVFGTLAESQVGYERFFFDWYGGLASEERAGRGPAAGLYAGPVFEALRALLAGYEPTDPRRLEHPYFERSAPCTLLIEEIESIWEAIAERDDWSAFEARLEGIEEMRSALAGP